MRDRYSALGASARIFRLARRGGGHLPVGQRLPKPEWLNPTSEDVEEGERAGRPPGLSVWDAELTTVANACWFRGCLPANQEAFAADVSSVVKIGASSGRTLSVVADRHPCPAMDARWGDRDERERADLVRAAEGHSLIEGIARPNDTTKNAHRAFLVALCEVFDSHAG